MRVIQALASIVVWCIVLAAGTAAQIEDVTIRIDGMTCQLCAIQTERALRRLPAVATVRVVLADERAYVTLKRESSFEPETLRAAIRSAGQEVRSFDVRLCGMIESLGHERYGLRVPHQADAIAVRSNRWSDGLGSLVGQPVCARGRIGSETGRLELELTTDLGAP